MELTIEGKSDIGSMREENQDSLGELVFDRGVFIAVADGMGGYAGGSLASKLAIEALLAYVKENWKGEDTEGEQLLRGAIASANQAVRERAQSDKEIQDMGTTCVCILVKGDSFFVAHVGDSRAYLLRDGTFALLTEDHTVIQQLIAKGKVGPLEASYHPSAGILMRCLGQLEEVVPDVRGPESLKSGDLMLLCSDGLSGMVYEDEMAQLLVSEKADKAVESLVKMANEAGGFDNITVQLLQVDELPQEAPSWNLIVDSPEGLALAAAEGRLPPNLDEGKLRHTVMMPSVGEPDLSEPTVPLIEKEEEWKPGRDRLKMALFIGGGLILLGLGLLYWLL